MLRALEHFPALSPWLGLAALLAAGVLLAVLGGGGGGLRRRETDPAAGWGLAALAFSMGGIIPGAIAGPVALALALAAGLAAWSLKRRNLPLFPEGAARGLVLTAPLLAVAALGYPSGLADFEAGLWPVHHWLQVDSPARGTMTALPGYLAGKLVGGQVEQAGALFAVLALSSFGLVLARLFIDGQGVRRPGWGIAAGGLLAAFVATPALDIRTVLGTGGETVGAVMLALSAWLAAAMVEAVAGARQGDALAAGWKLGLALAGTASLAPVGAPLALLLLVASVGLSWRAAHRMSAWLTPCLIAAAPCLVAVAGQWLLPPLPLAARSATIGFAVPVSLWEWLRLAGHFGIMAAACGLGVRALIRRTAPWGRLSILFLAVALAAQALPLVTDIGWWTFHQWLCALAALALLSWLAECRHWPEWSVRAGYGAAILVVSAPVAAMPLIRFDRVPPLPTMRLVTEQTGQILGQGDRVAVFDLSGRALTLAMLRWSARGRGAEIEAGASDRIADVTHILVRGTHPVTVMLGVDPADGQSVLLRRSKEGWILLRRWSEASAAKTAH